MLPTEHSTKRDENHRETGARKYPPEPGEMDRDRAGLEAAENKGSGLSEPMSETPEKVRKSDGQNPPARQATPSPASEKLAGAGPAIAERSKDAKAAKGTAARQPGAFVKDK